MTWQIRSVFKSTTNKNMTNSQTFRSNLVHVHYLFQYLLEYFNLFKHFNWYLQAVDYRKKDHVQKKIDVGFTYSNNSKQDIQPKEDQISGYNNGTAVRDDLDYNDENDIGKKIFNSLIRS